MIKRFFGWLFVTQAYLDTLSDVELMIRAGGDTRGLVYWAELSRRGWF